MCRKKQRTIFRATETAPPLRQKKSLLRARLFQHPFHARSVNRLLLCFPALPTDCIVVMATYRRETPPLNKSEMHVLHARGEPLQHWERISCRAVCGGRSAYLVHFFASTDRSLFVNTAAQYPIFLDKMLTWPMPMYASTPRLMKWNWDAARRPLNLKKSPACAIWPATPLS